MDTVTLIDRIEARLSALGLTARKASLLASGGRNAEIIRNIQRVKTAHPRTDTINGLAQALDCSAEWLMNGGPDPAHPSFPKTTPPSAFGVKEDDVVLANFAAPNPHEMPRDLPVLGTAAGARSESDGAVQMVGGPVEYLRRPAALEGVEGAYVVYVVNDSMEPALPHGEAALVHPHRPVRPGDNVVVQVADENGEVYAFVKRLVRRTQNAVLCSQHNPPKEVSFENERVLSVHKVLSFADILSY